MMSSESAFAHDPTGASLPAATGDWSRVVRAVRAGFPARSIDAAARRLRLSREAAARAVGINERRLYRRLKSGSRLTPDESQRVLRLNRVGAHALAVFDDAARARRWLSAPNRALRGEAPLGLLDTDVGGQAVDDLLGRIEHGVLA